MATHGLCRSGYPCGSLLPDSEQLFRLMIASVRDYAIFMLDPAGRIATWNAGAERIKGYKADEIIGKHFSVFYPEADVQAGKCDTELEVAVREDRFEDLGWRIRKDGSQFWANVVITAVRDDQGTLVGFSKVTRDLTERKRAEEERAARLAAEEASRAKDEFLAMLGHELRNPLAPILTALQLLKLRGETVKEHEVIDRQVRYMMRLVDDLLDVSRITRDTLELKRKRIDLRGVLAKAIEIAGPLIDQRGHKLNVEVPAYALGVDGDEARLTQVFANLLTNAAKYTDPGGHIGVDVRDDGPQLRVDVTDDGIGIDAELLPRVFELFVQGKHRPEHGGSGGLGLGLTLAKRLIQLHGGSVEVTSAGLGKGSTFSVALPAVALEQDTAVASRRSGALAAITTQPRRILVVDDNEDALVLLAEALQLAGHTVRTATDPAGALAEIAEFKPDLAILDIGLPMMDGYELAAKIRTALGGTPRLFALTGYGQPADRERSHKAGFTAHFVKPVDVRQIIEIIAKA
jgi:PAS domain S-box-containing protein